MRGFLYIVANYVYYFWGLLYLTSAIFLGITLSTYSNSDYSFNKAIEAPIHNLAGKYGAYIADPIWQFLGISALLGVLFLFCWGIKILRHQKIKFFLFRAISSVVAISMCAALSHILPYQGKLFSARSWGGWGGKILYNELYSFIHQFYNLKDQYVWLILAVTFTISSIYSLAFSVKEWRMVFSIIKKILLPLRLVKFIFVYLWQKLFKTSKTSSLEEELEEIIDFPAKLHAPSKKSISKKPSRFLNSRSSYRLPATSLLSIMNEKKKRPINEQLLAQNAIDLTTILKDFGVKGEVTDIHTGPVVTLYEFKPSAGTKSSRVIGLADDLARSMSAISARIAVIAGKDALGIELPNKIRETVYLRELLEAHEYQTDKLTLPIILGKDISGAMKVVDLAKMPHLLVAGTTGSGKSVAINTMILSLIYRLTPSQCKFIMIDPKMLELSVYEGIPHLLTPVVTDPSKAVTALKWAVKEMENRYKMMSNLSVRNISGYNERIAEALAKGEKLERTVQTGFDQTTGRPIYEKVNLDMDLLPYIVLIVDEMADLMLVAGKDIESLIQRLAQMARAAGIHIIMATQRPSVDVITGVIKANFPTRISFQVTSKIDSRTILGEQGAEQLLGMGDMLYMSSGSRIVRIHGPFVSDEEVEKVVAYLKTQGEPTYIEEVLQSDEEDFSEESFDANDKYQQAVTIVLRDRKASTSYIQRRLSIGYNKAALLIERMEKEGIISAADHVGRREILRNNPI